MGTILSFLCDVQESLHILKSKHRKALCKLRSGSRKNIRQAFIRLCMHKLSDIIFVQKLISPPPLFSFSPLSFRISIYQDPCQDLSGT